MNARTYGGSGRHALPAVKRPDGSDMVRLVKGSPDDIRKVLWRNGVDASWMDSQAIDPNYQGRHCAANTVYLSRPDLPYAFQVAR